MFFILGRWLWQSWSNGAGGFLCCWEGIWCWANTTSGFCGMFSCDDEHHFSIPNHLLEASKVSSQSNQGIGFEWQEALWEDVLVLTWWLMLFFPFQHLMSIQVCLVISVHKLLCMINKNVSTSVHEVIASLALWREETSISGAEKVVNRDLLTWK